MKASTAPSCSANPWARTAQVRTTRIRSPRPRPATAAPQRLAPRSGKSGRSGVAFRGIDAIGLELPVEVTALDPEALGGTRHVPVVGAKLGQDVGALEVVA